MNRLCGCLLVGLLSALGPAAAEVTAFVGATIMPISGPAIADGVLIIEDDEIRAVGARDQVRIPRNATLVELSSDQVIIPGLVDTHSHIGQVSGADRSAPIQPDVRALDSINVRDASLKRALAGGVTTVNIMPGSGYLLSGQTIYLKLREGNTVEALGFPGANGELAGGLKMANGTNARRNPPFPGTRAKAAALVRAQFVKAMEYRDKLARAGDKAPDRDLGLEALVEVLAGERIVHHHTHRHDDIMTVLRLKDEFGFRVVLHHVSEAAKVADEIAAADVPVSLILIDSPGGKLETVDIQLENGAALERAGADVAFHTDDYITDSRLFLRMAAVAVRAGMTRDSALRALTLAGAKMLDLEQRVGSLEPGKDADFVILSGDPLSVYTRVQQTWVEGVKRFDLDDPDDRLVAEGGYGALTPGDVHLHDLGHGGVH